jgi:hypothetical protein
MRFSLLGIDSIIFSTFSSFASSYDVRVSIRPLLVSEAWDEELQNALEEEDLEEKDTTERVGKRFCEVKPLRDEDDEKTFLLYVLHFSNINLEVSIDKWC